MNIRTALLVIACGALIWSCSKNEQKSRSEDVPAATAEAPAEDKDVTEVEVKFEYQMSGIPFDLNGTPVSVAGMTFTPASQWTDLGASGSQVASYYYGPLEGDTDSATVTVHYFGKSSGTIQDGQERWISQFSMPDGRDPHTATLQYTKVIDSMNVHVLTLMGNYHLPPDGTVIKEKYRLNGIVVEAPEGNVFLKLTGPEYTSRIMIEAFITMVFQIKRTG
ncbi:MAG: hypothetical protein OEW00_09890 [candidate division Zixibacteria bacterium]|nr:hypothetical protein [candidate division Zixibacteria bacterium]